MVAKLRGRHLALWALLVTVALATMGPEAFAGYVVADVDKAAGTTDDQFVVTVVVNGKLQGEPSFPKVPGLKVVGSSRQKKGSLDVLRGQMNTELQFVFFVTADRTGTYTIPPFVLTIDGKEEKTAALTIKVSEDVAEKDEEGTPEIIVQRRLQKREIYLGEALTGSIKVAHRVQMFDPQAEQADVPDMKRISPDQQEQKEEEIRGATYKTVTLGEVWIAKKAGKYKLPGFSLSVRKPVISRGLDVFGLDAAYAKRKKFRSKTEEITVKPLPEQGQPSNFSGIVGQFSMAAQVASHQVKVGDTVNVQVRFFGQGSAEGMPPLALDSALPVRVYADKPEYKEQVTIADGLTSEYKVSLAVVPTQSGPINLGRLKVDVFNPHTGKYEEVGADLGTVDVVAGNQVASNQATTPPPARTQPKATVDPGTLKTGDEVMVRHALQSRDYWLGAGLLLVFIALNAALYASQFWRQGKEERQQRRLRSLAARRLIKDLEQVKKRSQQQTSLDVVEDLASAFTRYLTEKWNDVVSGLTPRDLGQLLNARGVPQGAQQSAVKAWEVIERARFSGSIPSPQELTQVLNAIQAFVKGVEGK